MTSVHPGLLKQQDAAVMPLVLPKGYGDRPATEHVYLLVKPVRIVASHEEAVFAARQADGEGGALCILVAEVQLVLRLNHEWPARLARQYDGKRVRPDSRRHLDVHGHLDGNRPPQRDEACQGHYSQNGGTALTPGAVCAHASTISRDTRRRHSRTPVSGYAFPPDRLQNVSKPRADSRRPAFPSVDSAENLNSPILKGISPKGVSRRALAHSLAVSFDSRRLHSQAPGSRELFRSGSKSVARPSLPPPRLPKAWPLPGWPWLVR